MRKISRVGLEAKIVHFASEKSTLEIGSYGSPQYIKYFPNRTGVDIRPGKGVDIVTSVYSLPFNDNLYENILCISVLEHLEKPQEAIKEMQRVLKPGGKIIVSVPFLFPIHDAPGDYWRFTKYGLQYLFKEGWEIEQLTAETSTQKSLASIMQRIGFQSKYRFNAIVKILIYFTSALLNRMPELKVRTFGDIHKKTEVPDAFAGSFFLVAKKSTGKPRA